MTDVVVIDFRLLGAVDLAKSIEERVHGEPVRFVSGVASMETPDQVGETVTQRGMDLDPLTKSGWINWDHMDLRRGMPEAIIGIPRSAEIRKSEDPRHRGIDTLVFEGTLFNDHPPSDTVWSLLNAIRKSQVARKLGWSIQGSTILSNGGRLLKSVIRDMAMTHKPVHQDTYVSFQEIVKSFDSDGIMSPRMMSLGKSMTVADAGPLLTEDLAMGQPGQIPDQLRSGSNLVSLAETIYGKDGTCARGHFDRRGQFPTPVTLYDHLTECLGAPPDEAGRIVRFIMALFPHGGIS